MNGVTNAEPANRITEVYSTAARLHIKANDK